MKNRKLMKNQIKNNIIYLQKIFSKNKKKKKSKKTIKKNN